MGTLELDDDEYPSDETNSIATSGDDDVFVEKDETPVDRMLRLRAKSAEPEDYFEGREIYCNICFNLGFRTCTYPCRNSRDISLIPPWIFVKFPRDHVWYKTCIDAINEHEDRDRYYSVLMNNERYCPYHPNDFNTHSHKDVLTLGYIVVHGGKQVSDRYWINKTKHFQGVLLDDVLSMETTYINEFRERIELNDLD
jgi:hypothetical protein